MAGSLGSVTSTHLLPHLALSRSSHDRLGLRRSDDAWLAARWAEPDTRVLVIRGNRMHAVDGQLTWVAPADAPDGIRTLLGQYDGRTYFAVIVGDLDTGPEWVGLRAVVANLLADPEHAPLVLHAVGLAEWHLVTRHCPRCGAALTAQAAGHELHCPDCGRTQFPRTDAAVIMAVVHGEPGSAEERLLLARGAGWPETAYSTLAGFLEPGETLEDAVRREVEEEVGVRVGAVEFFGNQPWPLPASLMLGFIAHVDDMALRLDPGEIADARWFTRDELAAAYDDGTLRRPPGVSISQSLVEQWLGAPISRT